MMSTVLVHSATGGQGRAVVKHLLAAGHRVRVLVRGESSAERALATARPTYSPASQSRSREA